MNGRVRNKVMENAVKLTGEGPGSSRIMQTVPVEYEDKKVFR
jgi:hypothetical protein